MPGQTDKEFLIRVKADLDQAKKELAQLRTEFDKTQSSGKGAGKGLEPLQKELRETGAASQKTAKDLNKVQKELNETEGAGNKASRGVAIAKRGMLAFAAAALTYVSLNVAADLAQTADKFNFLQDRIRTATRVFGDYNTASRELFAISQRNGTALEDSVELFQRLARSAPALKATQDQVLAVTNAVSQLGRISGATPDQLKFGLQQLGQAFSYPIVQAQEINSVLENIPEVATRIEQGLGLMPGTLKQVVNEGKILGRDIFGAILKQTDDINKQFQELPDRLGPAVTRFKNAFGSILSDIDKSIGLTQKLAAALNSVSDAIAPIPRSAKEIGKELDQLLAKQALVGATDRAHGQGRRGQAFADRIKELRDELQLALASSGDVAEVNKALDEVDQRIAAINKRIAETPDSQRQRTSGVGRFKNRRTEFGALLDELKSLEDQRKIITERIEKLQAEQKKAGAGAGATLTQEQIQAREAIDKTVASLQLEAATLGKTRTETVLYELGLKGATEAQLKQAKTALEMIDAHEKMVDTQRRVKEIIEATRTPAEQLAAKTAELNELYRQGAFGAVDSAEATETLRRAIANAKKDVEDLGKQGRETFDGELNAAIRGWGDTITDTLTNMVVTGKGSFKELANAIIRDLVRIWIQTQIVLPALRAIFPSAFAPPAPVTLPSMSVPVQHAGGAAGRGPTRMDSPLAFLNAPRYHTGLSFVGLKPDEHRAILQTGERVLSREQNKMFSAGLAMGGGGGGPMDITLNIQNQGTPQQAVSASGQFDGKQFVINVMTEDQARNGPITQGFSRTFALRRKAE